jgi:hypothetical protein
MDLNLSLSNRQLHKALTLLCKTFPPAVICEMVADASRQAANELPLRAGVQRAKFSLEMRNLAKEEETRELEAFFACVPDKHLDLGKTIKDPVYVVDDDDIATNPGFIPGKALPLSKLTDRR